MKKDRETIGHHFLEEIKNHLKSLRENRLNTFEIKNLKILSEQTQSVCLTIKFSIPKKEYNSNIFDIYPYANIGDSLKKIFKFNSSRTNYLNEREDQVTCTSVYYFTELKYPIGPFKINDYLELRFEDEKTQIYIGNKRFLQCRYLLLNIPKTDPRIEDIKSIDEAEDYYSRELEYPSKHKKITPEEEFWGHCSNLQAWFKYDYDSRLLHRNIAFPILRELAYIGDPLAERAFKEEIILRLKSGYPNVVIYLLTGYFTYTINALGSTYIEASKRLYSFSKEWTTFKPKTTLFETLLCNNALNVFNINKEERKELTKITDKLLQDILEEHKKKDLFKFFLNNYANISFKIIKDKIKNPLLHFLIINKDKIKNLERIDYKKAIACMIKSRIYGYCKKIRLYEIKERELDSKELIPYKELNKRHIYHSVEDFLYLPIEGFYVNFSFLTEIRNLFAKSDDDNIFLKKIKYENQYKSYLVALISKQEYLKLTFLVNRDRFSTIIAFEKAKTPKISHLFSKDDDSEKTKKEPYQLSLDYSWT